jgi:hypothetical protein
VLQVDGLHGSRGARKLLHSAAQDEVAHARRVRREV